GAVARRGSRSVHDPRAARVVRARAPAGGQPAACPPRGGSRLQRGPGAQKLRRRSARPARTAGSGFVPAPLTRRGLRVRELRGGGGLLGDAKREPGLVAPRRVL